MLRHMLDNIGVDDASDNREMLRHMLDNIGVEVQTAADGREALERREEQVPDIAFIDLRMPAVDGWQVLSEIRSQPQWQAVKAVAISASTLTHQHRKALAAGFDLFIGKPLRFEQICNCLATLLGAEFAHAEGEDDPAAEEVVNWSDVVLPVELMERLDEAAELQLVTKMEGYFQEMEQLGTEAARLATHMRQLRRRLDMGSILAILGAMRHD
jgi:CheY-like chemotaxis protein